MNLSRPGTDSIVSAQAVPFLAAAALLVATGGTAGVLHVPDPHPTVQGALDSALPGDTVLVAPGTYVENIVWPGVSGIHLLSEQGALSTILDGGENETVIGLYEAAIDTTTRICGFTITNGKVGGT